jgi:hypothetical protein
VAGFLQQQAFQLDCRLKIRMLLKQAEHKIHRPLPVTVLVKAERLLHLPH